MKQKLDQKIQSFIVSQVQVELDLKMVSFDIWATLAHVLMLSKQKIISFTKLQKIIKALLQIKKQVEASKFKIDPEKGAQLSLETAIVDNAGKEAGLSVHTGRSRNDQVMVTEMLYLKHEVLLILKKLKPILSQLFLLAQEHHQTIMPGYTHMQPAKPTTFGSWCLAYLSSLLKTSKTLTFYYQHYDLNPLGACEAYGTSWCLDREFTSKLLGFAQTWEIPQAVISSRGFPQLGYLTGLQEISLVASKMAQDLLLFNTFEYGIIGLGDEVAQRMHPITGSSVMAQKKNPDTLELIRATATWLISLSQGLATTLAGLPMGYNRDSREAKEYIDLGLAKTSAMLLALEKVLSTLVVDKTRMKALVLANYSLTTDLADFIAQKSDVGYRIIYKIIGEVVDELINQGKLLDQIQTEQIIAKAKKYQINLSLTDQELKLALDPENVLEKKNNIGGPGSKAVKLCLKNSQKEIKDLFVWIKIQSETNNKAEQKTFKLAQEILKGKNYDW